MVRRVNRISEKRSWKGGLKFKALTFSCILISTFIHMCSCAYMDGYVFYVTCVCVGMHVGISHTLYMCQTTFQI